MNTSAIVPATLEFNADGVPFSSRYGDVYHPLSGAFTQARHVFLAGNGLPARWHGRDRFVILEAGFGLGNNFLATWQAWQRDPQRCARLVFISIEKHPLARADLAAAHAASPAPELADALIEQWPPLAPNLHRLSFEGGQVQLLLALGDVAAWLPELIANIDAFYLDGFSPATNPDMWQQRLYKAMARLAAPGATALSWTAARAVREGLTSAGFEVTLGAGTGGKRDITLARFAPRFTPRRALARTAASNLGSVLPPLAEREAGGEGVPDVTGAARRAIIVGAGLAGCAAACALAEHGWRVTLLDRHPQIAQEASGNPAGLFHATVNVPDGLHARFNRAAAFQAQAAVRIATRHHHVAGATDGLLRLETTRSFAQMQAMLLRLDMPSDVVEAVDAARASELAGIALKHPAWFYPGGGWVQPAGLARSFVERAGDKAEFRGGIEVHSIERGPRGWRVLDKAGAIIDEAETLVIANAGGAARLLGQPTGAPLGPPPGSTSGPTPGQATWPIDSVRGQLSWWPASAAASHQKFDGSPPKPVPTFPLIPIAGAGYLLPTIDGNMIFGATTQAGDNDPAIRETDHRANLDQLERLTGTRCNIEPSALQGRTAWRAVTNDRLPLIGAVPDLQAVHDQMHEQTHDKETSPDLRRLRLDQPRFVPRLPGLFVFTALASRGITWCALGGQVLAASITGAPMPVEASLLDAIDPARFITRATRKSARVPGEDAPAAVHPWPGSMHRDPSTSSG
ncbi:bifunctional tRNA (5-methylaminomethyl-2-thiouridine)(34)-methyltransferase MnmD/FAD-dependent 5-carboxymethylaminomethyl-2-thiouridine(34) oxidoreductase MnmC [soil metagenome]